VPIYSFRDEQDELVEHHLSFERYEEIYRSRDEDGYVEIDGCRLKRDIAADLVPRKVADLWPLVSDSVGVDPSQIREAMARDAKMGVPTQYTREGDAIWRSEGHRSAYIKAMGYQDRRRYA